MYVKRNLKKKNPLKIQKMTASFVTTRRERLRETELEPCLYGHTFSFVPRLIYIASRNSSWEKNMKKRFWIQKIPHFYSLSYYLISGWRPLAWNIPAAAPAVQRGGVGQPAAPTLTLQHPPGLSPVCSVGLPRSPQSLANSVRVRLHQGPY